MPTFKHPRPALYHYNTRGRARLTEPVLCLSSDERKTPTEYYFVSEHSGSWAIENQEQSIQRPDDLWPTTFEWVDATDTHRALAKKYGVALEASK